jgi:hypothetical protein
MVFDRGKAPGFKMQALFNTYFTCGLLSVNLQLKQFLFCQTSFNYYQTILLTR